MFFSKSPRTGRVDFLAHRGSSWYPTPIHSAPHPHNRFFIHCITAEFPLQNIPLTCRMLLYPGNHSALVIFKRMLMSENWFKQDVQMLQFTCTKFAVRFVYVDTNNSVHSWQILYMDHVLWYVNGNVDNQNLLIAIEAFTLHWGKAVWYPWLIQQPVIIASNFTCSKVILSGNFYRRNAGDRPA